MSATLYAGPRSAGAALGLCGCTAFALFAGCFAAPTPSVVPAPSSAASETPAANAQALDLGPAGSVAVSEYEGIPTGEQRLGGVDFCVGDSAMRVGSRSFPEFPRSASGVAVGRAFRVAHFLHATNGGAFQQPGHPKHEFDGVALGEYLIRYEDGSAEKFPLRYGHEVRDWWNWDGSLPATNSEVVWTGENPDAAKYGVKVRLYKASWLNPHPEKQVATIDLISVNAKAAPVCFAITVDDDPTFVPPAKTVPALPPSAAPFAPPVEIASAPRVGEAPSPTAAPIEIASSQSLPEPAETPAIEAAPNVLPAAAPPDEAVEPKQTEPPASTDDPSSSRTKPTFNLFGAPEDAAEPAEEEEEPDFLGPPPERWEVVVDPPIARPVYPDPLPYERLDGIRPRRLIVPATPSPFLAVEEGAVDIEGFRVLDLRSGKQVASVDGLTRSKGMHMALGPALSPDGRLLAMHDFDTKSIYVGDLLKGKTQNRFSWSESEPVLLFAEPDVLAAISVSEDPRVEVWQLPLGARLASFELPNQPELNPPLIALSPGGRFLVLSVFGTPPEEATFYDLSTGKEAGVLRLKGNVVNAYFLAFGFSPDGKRFAGYMQGLENQSQPAGIHPAVVVWDVASGRPTYQSNYEYNGFDASLHKSARPLQWFPDGAGWLLSQLHIFDRKSGRIVRSFTDRMEAGLAPTGAQILDDRRLLISDGTSAGMEIIDDVRSPAAEADR
jgi:hypothetical protein